jgi:hypothetical protein
MLVQIQVNQIHGYYAVRRRILSMPHNGTGRKEGRSEAHSLVQYLGYLPCLGWLWKSFLAGEDIVCIQ